MIAPRESKSLRKTLRRTMWFFVGIFVFCLVESYLLQLAGLTMAWNAFVIIVTAAVFYLIFLLICAKIDKKKEEKMAQSKSKDPFSH